MIDDHVIDAMIEDVEGLPGMAGVEIRKGEHLKFKNVTQEVG